MDQSNISRTSGIKAKDKIGYLMGDFGSLCVFGLVQSVLQRYYTDILQINIVSIMTMMIVARIWDAINDPIWGRIIDSAQPKADGRYRRWIKIFAIPVAVSAVLMFVKIPGLTQGQYLAYAYVTYILFGMLYTCINIPYGSLAQVVTSSDKERSSLSVFRSVGSTFGAMQPHHHRRRCDRRAVRDRVLPLLCLEQGARTVQARPAPEGPDLEGHRHAL